MKISNPHIPISFLFYLACLPLPAFYIGDRLEPKLAIEVLMSGWLGPLYGHFSWYANPLYLLALAYSSRPKRSSALGLVAFALALSFLFHKQIAVSEAPTYKAITAYGWGYALWITSLAVYSTGQWLRSRGDDGRRIATLSIAVGGILLASYAAYYTVGSSSLFSIHAERDREFERGCAHSGEKIFRRTNDARGIYRDPDWEVRISTKSGFASVTGGGILGDFFDSNGHPVFYETKNSATPGAYKKYLGSMHSGFQLAQLQSDYAVITESHKVPSQLNILGATVTIKDLRDNTVLATSTFLLKRESGEYCGSGRGTRELITDVLGLSLDGTTRRIRSGSQPNG